MITSKSYTKQTTLILAILGHEERKVKGMADSKTVSLAKVRVEHRFTRPQLEKVYTQSHSIHHCRLTSRILVSLNVAGM